MSVDVILPVQLILATAWSWAGGRKLFSREERRLAVESAAGLRGPPAAVAGLALALAEVALGVWLLLGVHGLLAATASAALLLLFIATLTGALLQGRVVSCYCFGRSTQPATWWTVARDAALLALSLVLLLRYVAGLHLPDSRAADAVSVSGGTAGWDVVPWSLILLGTGLTVAAVRSLVELQHLAARTIESPPSGELVELEWVRRHARGLAGSRTDG